MRARLTRLAAGAVTAGLLWAAPALAEAEGAMTRLIDALRMDDTVAIMREEGLLYGEDLAAEMMPEADLTSWRAHLERLYDSAKMQKLVEAGLAAELGGVDVAPLAEFFTSELGEEIVELEISAREAFLDTEVEAAAKEHYADLDREGAEIVRQIETLIADSDLIEQNVMGILNANLMLYRGLADGGAYDLSEEDMLRDVWSQEEGVRDDSSEWIGAYLLTAYQPLETDEIDRYIAMWRTEEGQALNRALFAVFDRMYEEISYLTGQAVAQHMRSQKL